MCLARNYFLLKIVCLSCFDLLIYELITTKWYQSRGGAIGCVVEFIFSFKEIKGV